MYATFFRNWIGPRDYLCVDCGMGFMLDEMIYIDVALMQAHHKECMTPRDFHNLMSNHPSIIGPNEPDRPLSLTRTDIHVVQFVRMLNNTNAVADVSGYPNTIKVDTNNGSYAVVFIFDPAGKLESINVKSYSN